MSTVEIRNANLVFNVQREKKLKDFFISGDKKFNDFTIGGEVKAINNLSLKIVDGESVAIIGHNGAGKSTLLKMICGIYTPTSGEVIVDGNISSMFELATGFEMESNGWDNIYLRGLMLGESPSSIKRKMIEIAEFSELGDYLDMPVKYYSSGMFVRLAFSVSTAIKPEILLLDEVVAAGDAAFLDKANRRMKELIKTSNIMIYVTHSMELAKEMCNRCIWLERGNVLLDGSPDEVTKAYIESTRCV